MSDKSFGDNTNRNFVKNPLLSTAVTGLSIEDLTHNAVLLPVSQIQGLTAKQDQQIEAHTRTLAYPNIYSTNVPTGDTNSNISPPNLTTELNQYSSGANESIKHANKTETSTSTKATAKTDDDFDVNEYFARLHGTRYVSAPVNSLLKDDTNANLEATEENLEEINLNEPDKPNPSYDVQQSLTADIAQNFSQLPTVLPQVASAVFSSFSNMLSLKSREVTPDESKPSSGYQVVQFENPREVGVPLMGVEEYGGNKEVAPPPKEPPASGIGNYRITTKKKAYAQIPGLRSGEAQTAPIAHVSPASQLPPFFTPSTLQNPPLNPLDGKITESAASDMFGDAKANKSQNLNSYTLFSPAPKLHIDRENDGIFAAVSESEPNLALQSQNVFVQAESFSNSGQGSTSIIPPPPMFSNQKKDSLTPIEKSILPPSVARRISSKAVVKQTHPTLPSFGDIFVPRQTDNANSSVVEPDLATNIEIIPLSSPNVSQTFATMTIASDTPPSFAITDTPTFYSPSTMQPFKNDDKINQNTLKFLPELPTNVLPPPISKPTAAASISMEPIHVPETSTQTKPTESIPATTTSSIFMPMQILPSTLAPRHTILSESTAPSVSIFTPASVINTKQLEQPSLPLNDSSGMNIFDPTLATDMISIPPPPMMVSQASAAIPVISTIPTRSTELDTCTNKFDATLTNDQPMFFDPNILPPHYITPKPIARPSQVKPDQLNQMPVETTQLKPLAEPPKATGNLSYRLTKKRPKYYSGPIEGVGAISNNVKPVIESVQTGGFQGAMFTPELKPTVTGDFGVAKVQPFEISKPTEDVPAYTPFGMSQVQTSSQSFNTAFDFSRPPAENYEPPKQDSKGFGIIGSLKSKLSSLDINKIQNSVTTFFDPAYNDTKKETPSNQDYGPYSQSQSFFGHQQGNNFEIFVPNVEPTQSYSQNYDRQNDYPIYNYPQENQYSNTYNYFPIQGQNTSGFSIDSGSVYASGHNKTEIQEHDINLMPINTQKLQENYHSVNINYDAQTENTHSNTKPTDIDVTDKTIEKMATTHKTVDQQSDSNLLSRNVDDQKSFHILKPEELSEKLSALQLSQDIEETNTQINIIKNAIAENKKPGLDRKENESNRNIASVSDFFAHNAPKTGNIFGNFTSAENITSDSYFSKIQPQINEDKSEMPFIDMQCLDLKSISLFSSGSTSEEKDFGTINKNSNENVKISDSTSKDLEDTEPLLDDSDKGSELSICETCREVNKSEHDERDTDDLTDHLIENINSQIQLLNTVEVPLTEGSSVEAEFDPEQCSEITHITEETIEAIHAQSAVELLGDDGLVNIPKYGWNTGDHLSKSNILSDHNYQTTNTDLFGDSFFDNIHNASDEVKAELKAHEDLPITQPSHMSMPTAPPEDDLSDDKSDDTGDLDVHSIEQDAKKDFPLFDEYVIEPSETDDDKIECKERRASEDTAQDADTFTKRVEKFKTEIAAETKNFNTSGPTIMASYFDTGNYAAESHFQKIKYLTELERYTYGISNFRVPPGFEEVYESKLCDMANISTLQAIKDEILPSPNITETPQFFGPDRNAETKSVTRNTDVKTKEEEFSLQQVAESLKLTELLNAFDTKNLPDPMSAFGSEKVKEAKDKVAGVTFLTSIKSKEISPQAIDTPNDNKNLPDPINFFSSPSSSTQNLGEEESFNRLASYFSSPTKTDNTKSFFELSQSQDHYRQADQTALLSETNNNITGKSKPESQKSFFELSQSQNHYMDPKNIPPEQYMANLNLMRDLTSCDNIEIPKEQIVRTVNYFTIEYNNDVLYNRNKKNDQEKELQQSKLHICSDKLDVNKLVNNNNNDNNNNEIGGRIVKDTSENVSYNNRVTTSDNLKVNNLDELNETRGDYVKIVTNCQSCCSFHSGNMLSNVEKVKQSMDGNSEENRRGDCKMSQNKEDTPKDSVAISVDYTLDEEPNEGVTVISENRSSTEYSAVKHHWFYRMDNEGKSLWKGFSVLDSRALEEAFHRPDLNEHVMVATDGGRYDVNIVGRLRTAVYWNEKPTNVRRCSWFYKGTTDARYVPYTEPIADKLETEYCHAMTTNEWHRQISLPNNEMVVMHGPSVIAHFQQSSTTEPFVAPNQTTSRPRVVRRGHDESEIEDTEPSSIDHLLLLCHGVGSACDMKFRPVEEVVNDFRATSLQLIESHYKNSYDSGVVGRVEVLPISWHSTLHTGPRGVDRLLSRITLDSIPMLRSFTNDTILDVLFYTSPVYSQTIIDTVCSEINRIYKLFKSRNPNFDGNVSLGGHSLGSVVLYDLLSNQSDPSAYPVPPVTTKQLVKGAVATQPTVTYPQLDFSPFALFALGSPIAIFECIRGVESLGVNFAMPTCKNFFNIFHPYDPIAYRIEPLINAELQQVKPVLIPHHKGRKRMHLELKETMSRVGADLKQRLMESIKATWASVWRSQPPTRTELEKVVEEEIEKESLNEDNKDDPAENYEPPPGTLGKLNAGRRIDYVLQEAPFEIIYEYLFAMKSHVCYWMSEDTMLMILREIYSSLGVRPDGTVSVPGMTVERTRTVKQDDVIVSGSDGPSTSRGGT